MAEAAPHARHYQGSLEFITDNEHRKLRPIGVTAREVATRTTALLTEVIRLPGVQVFLGSRPAGTDLPPVSHTICAGRRLVLIESVAWPPGHYETTADGRVHCDGVYIGQSVSTLSATARTWQELLSRGHQVSSVVVVHPTSNGEVVLPQQMPAQPSWVHPGEAVGRIMRFVHGRRQTISRNTIRALAAGCLDA